MPKVRVHVLQLRSLCAAAKTYSQYFKKEETIEVRIVVACGRGIID